MPSKLKILFLCTGNSCRSQMAEGWARRFHGDRFELYSAGTRPGQVDPRAVIAMGEAGVDLSTHHAKHLAELEDVEFDWVVTVCDHANADCPVFPGDVKRLHVGFDDPPRLAVDASSEESALEHYRRVREEIRAFTEDLPATLGIAGEPR